MLSSVRHTRGFEDVIFVTFITRLTLQMEYVIHEFIYLNLK